MIMVEQASKIEALTKESGDLRKEAENSKQESKFLDKNCKELTSLLEDYREYRDKFEESKNTMEEMSMDLEILQNYCESLKSRLAVLEPDGSPASFGGKTLLGEYVWHDLCFRIEDRRQELESENARLAHSNMLSMSDRARMKAHVQSLTLLAANKSSTSAVKPLVTTPISNSLGSRVKSDRK
jgi:chromosome segregation ATPase